MMSSPSTNVAIAAAPNADLVVKKPKRPLSAFNLFYRFKRQKVLQLLGGTSRVNTDEIARLVKAPAGLEHHPSTANANSNNPSKEDATDGAPKDGDVLAQPILPPVIDASLNILRRKNIRDELVENLLPRDTRDRQHRTNSSEMNGTMSFLELGKLMNDSWKQCDEFARGVFNELAEDGREMYRNKLKEYNDYAAKMGLPKEDTKAAKKKKGKSKKGKKRGNDDDSDEEGDSKASKEGAGGSAAFLDFLGGAGGSLEQQQMLLRMLAAQQGMGSLSSAPADQVQGGSPINEDRLRLRVRELEGQLAAERLRARVQELEGALSRQKTVEEQLRGHLEMLSSIGNPEGIGQLQGGSQQDGMGMRRNNTNPSSSANEAAAMQAASRGSGGGNANQDEQGDGLWSLVSASMIHPSFRAQQEQRAQQERNAMLHQMQMLRARQQGDHVGNPNFMGGGMPHQGMGGMSPDRQGKTINKKQRTNSDHGEV